MTDVVPSAPSEYQSVFVGGVAILLAAALTFGVYVIDGPAAWAPGIGAGLIGLGVFGGVRGLVGCGVALLGVGALLITNGQSLPFTLAVAGGTAAVSIAVLLTADMSFVMRRASVVSPVTVHGLATAHVIATCLGLGLAAVLVSAVLAVAWPGWLLLLPAILLGAGSLAMARAAYKYNRAVHAVPARRPVARRTPPPPPPGIRSTMPPPPAPGIRSTMPLPPPPAPGTRSTMPLPPPPAPGIRSTMPLPPPPAPGIRSAMPPPPAPGTPSTMALPPPPAPGSRLG